MPEAAPGHLLDAARRGDRAALARLLSLIERGGDAARRVGRATHGLGIDAYTIGITGAPGAGKSTLTSALVDVVRRRNRDRVAVLAIDPSSPFSGGAILGDRVRMGDHALDEGVFIRSMATRGIWADWRWPRPRRCACSRLRVIPGSSWRRSVWGRPRSRSSARPTPPSSW
ncbi:MAG TPA: hypothetical protein VKA42_02020 [Acidimicrobiales bacterium]|nr:hypothetical protein [Acidimicrobiales bacterium]